MTPRQIELVRTSFADLMARREEAGHEFYAHFFKLDPQSRPLFRGDMAHQERIFMNMIGLIVKSLDIRDKVVPIIHDLGRRHAIYGVGEEDYAPFGEALIATLKGTLGESFDGETEAAWREAYDFMADAMK